MSVAEVSRLTVDLPKKKHNQVRRAALNMGISMKELVILSLDEFMHRKPNEKTEEALRQSESRRGLKKFKNIEDLFEDLEN